MDKNEKFEFEPDGNKRKPLRLFTTLFWAMLCAIALGTVISPYLSNVLKGLLTGCTSLLVGIVVAFLFSKLVNFIENKLLKNWLKNNPHKFAIKRFVSIAVVVLIIIGIFVLVFSILIPKIVEIVQQLTTGNGDGWEQMVNRIVEEICSLIQNWFGADVDQASIKSTLNSLFDSLRTTVLYIDSLLALSVNVISGIFSFIIGILIAIMILNEKERIGRFSRRFLYANFKKERADKICVMSHNASKILYDYAICQFIQFVLLFIPLGIGYSILGLKFTWELALIIGLFNFIPYFGIYIGCVPAMLITLVFDSMSATIYMLIVTLAITVIEFNILFPIIMGNKLKLSTFAVTASVIIGGAMFGILGMFLAPPITALISVIVMGNIEFKENKMKYLMSLQELEEERKRAEQNIGITPQVEATEEKTYLKIQEKPIKKSTKNASKTTEKLQKNSENLQKNGQNTLKIDGKSLKNSEKTAKNNKENDGKLTKNSSKNIQTTAQKNVKNSKRYVEEISESKIGNDKIVVKNATEISGKTKKSKTNTDTKK